MMIIVGCAKQNQTDSVIVKKAITDYNNILIQVYSTGKIDLLNSVAMEKEVDRVHLSLSLLNDDHQVLWAKLLSIKFQKLQTKYVGGFMEGEVQTEEVWQYRYLNPINGIMIGSPKDNKYITTYKLVKSAEGWKVYEVKFKEEAVK